MLVWYIREFFIYIQFPSTVIYVYWQWRNQNNPEAGQLAQLIIDGFFALGALCFEYEFILLQQTIAMGSWLV